MVHFPKAAALIHNHPLSHKPLFVLSVAVQPFVTVRDRDSNSCYFCLMLEYSHTSPHSHCAHSLLILVPLHLCFFHDCVSPQSFYLLMMIWENLFFRFSHVTIWLYCDRK